MKTDPNHIKKLTAWLKQIRQQFASDPWPATDPLTRLVLGFLQWNATKKQADLAFGRLMHSMVDINDLRVSHPQEIISLLGERYPRVHERAARMHDVLQMVFEREHAVSLDSLGKKNRKEIIAYLTSLPGMVTYVAAQLLLLNFDEPCIPMDEAMLDRLKAAGMLAPQASMEEASAQIFKLIKPADAICVHQAMRAWADATPLSASPTLPEPVVSPPSAKSAAKPAQKKPSKEEASEPVAKSKDKDKPKDKPKPAAKPDHALPADKPATKSSSPKPVTKKPSPKKKP